jgi:hypothetical protein
MVGRRPAQSGKKGNSYRHHHHNSIRGTDQINHTRAGSFGYGSGHSGAPYCRSQFEGYPEKGRFGFSRYCQGSHSVATKAELKGDDQSMNRVVTVEANTIAKTKMDWLRTLEGNRYIVLVFRLILAAFFLVSSYGKLVDIERYSVDAVYNFGVLPMFLARPFGLVMPFIELLCCLGLLFGVLTRLSALGVALMSLSFFIAKAIVLSQGRSIECGCFGAVIDTLASVTIFMDIPMMILALVICFSAPEARHWLAIGQFLPSHWKERFNLIW